MTEVETELVTETKKPNININELLNQYNSTKANASQQVKSLTDSSTLRGMDSINELVTEAMFKIKTFVDNGKEKTTTGKALAIASKIPWAGKWLDNSVDAIEEEKLKEKTINQIIDTLVEKITEKREEVLDFIEAARAVKVSMLNDIETYKEILTNAEEVISSTDESSREALDANMLASMARVSIQGLQSDLKSQVNPLISGATISCNQIAAILPTIEQDLKYKAGFKAFQQSLSDLNGIVKTTTELASNAGDIIRKDVNQTIYSSIEMLSENGIDTQRLAKIEKEEQIHQQKLIETMDKTKAKMSEQFADIKQMYANQLEYKQKTSHTLIEQYSKVVDDGND